MILSMAMAAVITVGNWTVYDGYVESYQDGVGIRVGNMVDIKCDIVSNSDNCRIKPRIQLKFKSNFPHKNYKTVRQVTSGVFYYGQSGDELVVAWKDGFMYYQSDDVSSVYLSSLKRFNQSLSYKNNETTAVGEFSTSRFAEAYNIMMEK